MKSVVRTPRDGGQAVHRRAVSSSGAQARAGLIAPEPCSGRTTCSRGPACSRRLVTKGTTRREISEHAGSLRRTSCRVPVAFDLLNDGA